MAYLGANAFRLARRAANHVYFEPNLPLRYGRGSWVMLTGSTEGIGKGLADQFAE